MSNPSIEFTLLDDEPEAGAVVGVDAPGYARMLKFLLPPGKVWRLDAGSLLSQALLAVADELARVDERVRDLLTEANPETTSELLGDFERVLDLVAEGTEAERVARVVALLIRRQRYRPEDFRQALAPLLGQDAADVQIIERSRAFAVSVGDDSEIFKFYVYRDPTAPGTYDLDAAQDLVDSMKPSHTEGFVVESVDLLCDDPYSLCDRDFLGV